jgi:hypothetical protein
MSDGPPPALAERLAEAVDASSPPEAYLEAALVLLGRLVHDGCATRAAALDLLVADALVTAAFEVASAEPASVEDRAATAVRRIAALGAT